MRWTTQLYNNITRCSDRKELRRGDGDARESDERPRKGRAAIIINDIHTWSRIGIFHVSYFIRLVFYFYF